VIGTKDELDRAAIEELERAVVQFNQAVRHAMSRKIVVEVGVVSTGPSYDSKVARDWRQPWTEDGFAVRCTRSEVVASPVPYCSRWWNGNSNPACRGPMHRKTRRSWNCSAGGAMRLDRDEVMRRLEARPSSSQLMNGKVLRDPKRFPALLYGVGVRYVPPRVGEPGYFEEVEE